ncbi:hypothetical protein MYU51_016443 [Penicillium brevicompactum]
MRKTIGNRSSPDELNVGHQLHTLGDKLSAFANNPARLERDRTRFDKDDVLLSDDSGDTVLGEADIAKKLGRRNGNLARLNAMTAWKSSIPGRQFERQTKIVLHGLEASPHESQGCEELANDMVREEWKAQGIWNQKWGSKPNQMPEDRWMHEEAPSSASQSEGDTVPVPNTNIASGFESAEQKSAGSYHGIGSQEATEKTDKQKHNRDSSRPFHQFIHQLSKERERLLREDPNEPTMTFDNADINSIAYEIVKNHWKTFGMWNEKWGTIPGMKWKHEQAFEMPKNAPAPEPEKLTDDVPRQCDPGLVGLGRDSVPADAERMSPANLRRFSSVDEEYTLRAEREHILPANAQPKAPRRVQGPRKRKSTTEDMEQRAPKRRITRKYRSNIPNNLAEDTKNVSLMAVHGQENQNSHIRRSKRLTDRASSLK